MGAEDLFGPGYFFFIRDTTLSSYLDIINAYNRIYPVLDFCSGKLGPGIIFQENLPIPQGRSGAVDRASDFGPRGSWFDSPPVHISL